MQYEDLMTNIKKLNPTKKTYKEHHTMHQSNFSKNHFMSLALVGQHFLSC